MDDSRIISDAKMLDREFYAGPFKSDGGNIYVVLVETAGLRPEVYKTAVPPESFAAQDSDNRPNAVPASMDVYKEGDLLHIATQESHLSGAVVSRHTFDTESDSWIVTDEFVALPAYPLSGPTEAVSITVSPNGELTVLYSEGNHHFKRRSE